LKAHPVDAACPEWSNTGMPTPSENPANPQNTPDTVVEALLGAKTGNPPVVSEDGETTHPASEPPLAPESELANEAIPPPQP
jgi:hypothetical protein